MEQMNDLRTLLQHDIQKLRSVEEQIISALPQMIDKCSNPGLKQALEEHLRITEQQLQRLDEVRNVLGDSESGGNGSGLALSNLISGSGQSRAMQGLIEEGQELLSQELAPEVLDAAIIACCQKIEHHEIACYGTARTYAEQLGLVDAAQLLQQTLLEEEDADQRLSALAISDVNQKAEAGTGS